MFSSNKKNVVARIDSLIGLETSIDGDITFSGGLRVDGHVIGNVTSEESKGNTLVVSENASIKGVIRVGHLVLNGSVEGPIYANQYIELQSNGRVMGDVFYSTLEMHPGAVVIGQLVHVASDNKPSPLALAAKKEASVKLMDKKQES